MKKIWPGAKGEAAEEEAGEKEGESGENIDLGDSSQMNADQQALFLNFSRSKSADSFIGKLLPHTGEVPDRSLVWEVPPAQLTHNIILNQRAADRPERAEEGSLRVFRKIRKEKVKNRCDYDKNICGYITKKVIREFVGRNYEGEARRLADQHRCDYEVCKSYYQKKVEMVTGPSHLPELFNSHPHEPPHLAPCKAAFRDFYHWFLRERYLRYLLLDGKMTNKQAYIEYKNTHLFKFVAEDQPPRMHRARTRSNAKLEDPN